MEGRAKVKALPSTSTPEPPRSATSASHPPNPYARDPSRRAIACVTCAKAKTRCDKALPSCSRCTTKGIKCDPRSTRRTTDSTQYRALPHKRSLTAPKRFPTPSILPSTSFSSKQRTIMRAPSHIDFRTAVKMSQQKSLLSSTPKLTPLSTYQSHIVDECYSFSASPEPELRFTPEIEGDGSWFDRSLTPQTPPRFPGGDAVVAMEEGGYVDQEWLGGGLVPVGLGFGNLGMEMGVDVDMSIDMSMCDSQFPHTSSGHSIFNTPASFAPADDLQFDTSLPGHWPSLDFPAPIPDERFGKATGATHDSGIVMQDEWAESGQDSYVDMSLVTSAPYVPMHGGLGQVPVWEDVFMTGGMRF